MAHHLAHENNNYGEFRDVRYTYDELNRLTKVDDSKQDVFDEMFAYDAQGRITAQRRAGNVVNPTGGEYSYYSGKNKLKSVADNMGGTADERNMSDTANFVYDSVGNLTYDKYLQGEGSKNALVHFYCQTVVYCALRNSKGLEILYDWRGMPVEFRLEPTGSSSDTARLSMMYDGSGRRISKTFLTKSATAASWDTVKVTHYTDIGTEVRENYAGLTKETKVVVNMPQGLGRYGIEDAENPDMGSGVGYIPNTKFEWYLKNHLGSTMLVYGTQADANPAHSDIGTPLAAYDYRAFGEQVNLVSSNNGVDKVTENFTGKELDDEIALNYFGARYLDPMLGMWTSVDPMRQFASPYLYAGNGVNPVNVVDPNGNYTLNLNEDNTVASLVEDDNSNTVSLLDANGKLVNTFAAPPSGSYFFTEKLVGEKFDPNMQQNANAMIKDASQYWPADFIGWGTKGPFDFKNQYYFGADKTVGVLDGTIMTARDAGNAIWGGWTRHAYLCRATLGCDDLLPRIQAHLIMQGISKLIAPGFKEDPPSATMQSWGFNNYLPSTK